MTAIRLPLTVAAALAIVGLLAGCQPLPRPFAEDKPPADLLTVRDSIGIWIAPVEGEPPAATAKLGATLAAAFLKREIPASDRTTSLGSYQLYGRIEPLARGRGKPGLVVQWRLYDAGGKIIGEPTVQLEAAAKDWDTAEQQLVDRLAAASAEAVAPLLQEQAPAAQTVESGRTRVAIGEVKGAPGDGSQSLAKAVAAVLKKQDVAIVDDGKQADLVLDGEVNVAAVKPDKQHVKIVWRIRRADGAEIGTVGQENDVPKGMLDGPWGDVAYSVAVAAGDGLMALVARGAPEPKS